MAKTPRFRGQQVASDDKDVPVAFEGSIPSNHYCRAWNSKRSKYCRSRAGRGTHHLGVGRCSLHGGNHEAMHGRWSQLTNTKLSDAIKRFEEDPQLLDLRSTLALLYAYCEDLINRQAELLEAVLAWHALLKHKQTSNENLRRVVVSLLDGAPPPAQRHLLNTTVLRALVAEIRQMTAQIENIAGKVPLSDAHRAMAEMGRVVNLYIDNDGALEKIRDGWANIRI
jgi:hypothetical protein